jgi:hypothetical protein
MPSAKKGKNSVLRASELRKKPVSAGQAKRIAADSVAKAFFTNSKVLDGAKVSSRIYGVSREVWLVQHSLGTGIHSSEVLAICKKTGAILYHGPLNDEG